MGDYLVVGIILLSSTSIPSPYSGQCLLESAGSISMFMCMMTYICIYVCATVIKINSSAIMNGAWEEFRV